MTKRVSTLFSWRLSPVHRWDVTWDDTGARKIFPSFVDHEKLYVFLLVDVILSTNTVSGKSICVFSNDAFFFFIRFYIFFKYLIFVVTRITNDKWYDIWYTSVYRISTIRRCYVTNTKCFDDRISTRNNPSISSRRLFRIDERYILG